MNTEVLYVESTRVTVSNVGGAQVQFLASDVPFSEKTLDVLIGELPPSVFVPLHSHSGPEWFFLLSGEMEAYAGNEHGGTWKLVRAGELAIVPENVRHAWRNCSSSPARVLSFAGSNIFAVMRKVAVAAEKVQIATVPTTEFLKELQTVALKTGNWIATPEENAAIGLKF